MRREILIGLMAVALAPVPGEASFPLSAQSECGPSITCSAVVEEWNERTWMDLVDDEFQTGSTPIASVRWYTEEAACSGLYCDDQLQSGDGDCPVLDTGNHYFCGVTDELSNVLLNHAVGSNAMRFEKLRNFTELLRHPSINGLQCWMYYVQGAGIYNGPEDLCVRVDSASDASLRILHAYAIACSKQANGVWPAGSPDYCADYLTQGNAIFGEGTDSHGEIKILDNGEYYLAPGFDTQPGAPTDPQTFHPDYLELQALLDFARFVENSEWEAGVKDILEHYQRSTGDYRVQKGKSGHFDIDAVPWAYTCDEVCSPDYLDNIDGWRAVPLLATYLLTYPEKVPGDLRTELFDYWWTNYSGGSPALYAPTDELPFEIFADTADDPVPVRSVEDSYRTLAMWIPLAAAYDSSWTITAIDVLITQQYDWSAGSFLNAAYFGGYYSQFAIRSVATAAGMLDPRSWTILFRDGFESGGTLAWSEARP